MCDPASSPQAEVLARCRLYGILDLGYVRLSDAVFVAREMVFRGMTGDGGVDVLQIRAKHLPAGQIVELARLVRPIAAEAGVPLILNDFPALVASAGAHGAHIGKDDGALSAARSMMDAGKLIGRSTHSVGQALAAREEGADYIGFGPLFATPTKPEYPAIGLEEIAEVHARVPDLPIFCIGGIKLGNLAGVIEAGARRVVIVSGILHSADIPAYTAAAKAMLAG